MKNPLLFFVLITCFASGTHAQQNKGYDGSGDDNSNNIIHQGVNTINLYYGWNVAAAVYKRIAAEDGDDIKVKSTGPVGIVYEHLVNDVVGLGGEFGYSKIVLEYSETVNNPQPTTVYARWNFTTVRAMMRLNLHFANSPNFDAYALLSTGYKYYRFTMSFSDENYTTGIKFPSPIAIGIKPGLGFRYFFTPNVGLNAEIALGTPILCGGLTVKF